MRATDYWPIPYCSWPRPLIGCIQSAFPSDRNVTLGESMPAQLQAINGGSSILLDKPILLLGRDPECDIQLESPKISRRHC